MEMKASEDIEMGQDITPPLPPLAFSLHDSFLLSHCSCCFSPLPNPPFLPTTFPFNPHHVSTTVFYCSSHCSASDSSLHLSSAEHHLLLLLLQSHSATCPLSDSDSSDLRVSLRLLHTLNFNPLSRQDCSRIRGLLTNREKFLSRENLDGGGGGGDDDEVLRRVRDGAKAMAAARRMRDGEGFDEEGGEALVVEEAVLCLVLTNAVEVQVNGGTALGVAVYDTRFSWINHSCSPNACYRFLVPTSPKIKHCSGESRLRIVPGGECDSEIEMKIGICSKSGSREGGEGYGPRIVVRSIKAIKKGEEVSVAYADLLQPKAIRQSELWLKYRFMCCCSRCHALPPTYADQTLQEILTANYDSNSLSSEVMFYTDEAIRKMTDYVDDVISEYLSVGDPESCCEKLENLLTQGLTDEQLDKEELKSGTNFKLHPLNHLSLNAYTALASAYKIRASHLLDGHREASEHQLEAFNMSRTAAAYALLLAGATHRLFLSESSLIASLANFWTNAGESLLGLARSSAWNLILQQCSPISDPLSNPSKKCNKCSLLDRFEANCFCSQSVNAEFEEVSSEFLDCITNFAPKVWTFLAHGCRYLTLVRDPIDLSWLDNVKTSDKWDFQVLSGRNIVCSYFETQGSASHCELRGHTIHERVNLFQLGFHLVLYGGILSSICYGQHSHLTSSVRDLLHVEKNIMFCTNASLETPNEIGRN